MSSGSEARTRCRRCSVNLDAPVENPRSAFCCAGCHRLFYSSRCMACEAKIEKPTARRVVCRRRKCDADFRALKRHFGLGRYHPSTRVENASANPIKLGVGSRSNGRPTSRIVAGALTPEQLRFVTVGTTFGNCPLGLDRKLNRKHWLEAERKEIEANGHFAEPVWCAVISSDGVQCFRAIGSTN
jgi:hypothetical protein